MPGRESRALAMKSVQAGAWVLLGFGVAVGAGGLALQRQETAALREELALWRGAERDFERAQAENLRLRDEQVAPAEWAALRADGVLAEQRRKRIDELQGQLRAGKR